MAIKYYLGLDLGIASCGWAVMGEDTNIELSDPNEDRFFIHDFGVRIFNAVETPKTKVTLAAERRSFRATRRLYRRRHHRLERIKWAFEQNEFLTINEINEFIKSLVSDNGKTTTEKLTYDKNKFINPYVLRFDATKKKVSKQEVAYCILNLAKHRGYLNAFSDEEGSKSGLKTAQDEANKFLGDYKIISEAVVNNKDFLKNNKVDIRNNKKGTETNYKYLFKRKTIETELLLILNEQKKYYPEITDKLINKIKDILITQRDFETGPNWEWKKPETPIFENMIGFCKYEPNEKVGFKSSVIFELFHVASEVSKFTVKYAKELNVEKIHIEVLKYIIDEMFRDTNKKYSLKTEFKNIIKNNFNEGFNSDIKSMCGTGNPLWKNIDFKLPYIKKCKEIFGPDIFKEIDINNLIQSKKTFDLGEILSNNITPKRRKDLVLKKYQNVIDEKRYDKLKLATYKPTGTCNLSYKIMQEWLNLFIEGQPTNTFQHKYKIHPKFNIKENKFLGPINDSDIKTNQTVYRSINQTRKVLKALFNKYGELSKTEQTFQNINVEVARELYSSVEERKKIEQDNLKNRVKNAEIEKILKDNSIRANSTNILKYKLFISQKEQCLYCGKEIKLDQLSLSSDLEIDHIIPISKFSNDSFNNKVLVCSKCNQDKGDRTPLQWMNASNIDTKPYIARINKIHFSEDKTNFLLAESLDNEILEGFSTRNLNDTRYITRYIISWLQKELTAYNETNKIDLVSKQKGEGLYNVYPLRGNVTSRFRREWLRESPWGLDKKVRDITHWHHAVDAMIICSFINKTNIDFASDIIVAKNAKYKFDKKLISKEEILKLKIDIISKYNKHIFFKSAIFKIEKIFNGEIKKLDSLLSCNIKNFTKMLEIRIPVKLTKPEEVIIQKDKVDKILKSAKLDETQIEEKKEFTEWITKYSKVLTEEEYFAQPELENYKKQCNIHYPYISHMVIRKVKGRGSILGSQMPMKKSKVKKIKDENLIKIDKNGNTWDLRTYYGIHFDSENNFKALPWSETKKIEKYNMDNIIVPNENINGIFETKNFVFVYYGISGGGTQFVANINGLIKTLPIQKTSKFRFIRSFSSLGKEFKKFSQNENISILGEK